MPVLPSYRNQSIDLQSIDAAKSTLVFLSFMTLLRFLFLLLGFMAVLLLVLLFYTYLWLLILLFVIGKPSLWNSDLLVVSVFIGFPISS